MFLDLDQVVTNTLMIKDKEAFLRDILYHLDARL